MKLPAQPNQSILDGLQCLQAVSMSKKPIGMSDVARSLELHPTRVNRLLKTLAAAGMVRQTRDRKYTVGPGVHVLSAQALFASGLLACSLPTLESLHAHAPIVALGMLWRDQVTYLYHADRNHPDNTGGIARIGAFPACRSAVGMPLLALQPEDYVRTLYEGKNIPDYESLDDFLAELRTIRQQRYCIHHHKYANCWAMGIALPGEGVAVALSNLDSSEQAEQLLPHLEQAVLQIEHNLQDRRYGTTPA